MARILLTNDDGIHAPGLAAAREALAPLGEVVVVAPAAERSAASHAITLNRPLRMQLRAGLGHAVDGTPCDCVFLACEHLLRTQPPDLVVSGINRGGNLGQDVLYSGTVGAALEAALRGIPAIAVSLVGTHDLDFGFASRVTVGLANWVLANGLSPRSMLNVNVPKCPAAPGRWERTVLGQHSYGDVVERREDPRGRPYFWIAGRWLGYQDIAGTDCAAVGRGLVSITPLRARWSEPQDLDALQHLEIDGVLEG